MYTDQQQNETLLITLQEEIDDLNTQISLSRINTKQLQLKLINLTNEFKKLKSLSIQSKKDQFQQAQLSQTKRPVGRPRLKPEERTSYTNFLYARAENATTKKSQIKSDFELYLIENHNVDQNSFNALNIFISNLKISNPTISQEEYHTQVNHYFRFDLWRSRLHFRIGTVRINIHRPLDASYTEPYYSIQERQEWLDHHNNYLIPTLNYFSSLLNITPEEILMDHKNPTIPSSELMPFLTWEEAQIIHFKEIDDKCNNN